MSWGMYHSKSEQLAAEAESAIIRGKAELALSLYRQAAEMETAALFELEDSKVRTRGVTAVSAASLWYKASEFNRAEEVAHKGLATGSLPPFAVTQLRELLQLIWNEELRRNSGVDFVKGTVLVSVSGGQVVYGGAPLELIMNKVDQVGKYFYRVIEMLLGSPLRVHGGPPDLVKEQFRPWLFHALPSSYQFAVRVEKPKQLPLFPDGQPEIEEITTTFLSIVRASANDPEGELVSLVPNEEYRDTFLKMTRNLTPSDKTKTHERLTIRTGSTNDTPPIVLMPVSRDVINETLRKQKEIKTPQQEETRTITGILRGLQLNSDWIEVDVTSEEVDKTDTVRIYDAVDVIDDVIGPLVNQRVVVDCVVKPRGRLSFKDLQAEV